MRLRVGTLLVAVAFGVAISAERPVEFGIHTPQETNSLADLLAAWHEAERLGFETA